MKLNQNDKESILDKVSTGVISADEGNIQMVLSRRVLLVTAKVPASVRKALNEAVKSGRLGRLKKDGHKPEAYFHPTFEYLAKYERNKHERSVINALLSVCG